MKTHRKNYQKIYCQTWYKKVKISVISLSNTLSQPGAMMIKLLHTTVTIPTMHCSRWSVYTTCRAKFYF